MSKEQQFKAARRMESVGGGFAAAIARAYYVADSANAQRLVEAFSDLFERYAKDYADEREQKVRRRQALEDQVLMFLMATAERHGWAVDSVSDGEQLRKVKTMQTALEITQSVDESWIYFTKVIGERKVRVCVFVVRGNDGWDVIADSSLQVQWDEVMSEVDQLIDKLTGQQ